eukprot:gene26319-biopygen15795
MEGAEEECIWFGAEAKEECTL